MAALAIEVKDLKKNYGALVALKGLNFNIPQGEIVAFLGPNSAGKSTTLRILAGLIPATSGEAYINGIPVASHADEVKRSVGYMPEHNPLPEEATVSEYLRFRARLKGLTTKNAKARVDTVSRLCELNGRPMGRPMGVLSRGVRQRVGIAEALLAEPPILLLDEPTIGLDPHQVIALRELIGTMKGQHTVFVSTHILTEAETISDRVLIINKGEEVAFGTPEELRKKYQTKERYCVVAKIAPEAMKTIVEGVEGQIAKVEAVGDAVRYEVAIASAEGVQKLIAGIVGAKGGVLMEISKISPSLEMIFLEATAKGDEL